MDFDFSEMLTFVSTTMVLHAVLVIFWSIFFGAIVKFDLFSSSKIQNVKVKQITIIIL